MKRLLSSVWLASAWLVVMTALPIAQVQAQALAQAPTQQSSPAPQPKNKTPTIWERLIEKAKVAGKIVKRHHADEPVSHAEYDAMVAEHAKANAVPEALVHRVILRESRYQPRLMGSGGCIGLMQIKLGTARSLGYAGDAEGLRDPNTNLIYGIKYLAGAYRAANGDHNRAVALYTTGYYEDAKRQRLERKSHPEPVLASAPKQTEAKDDTAQGAAPAEANKSSPDANARQLPEK